MKHRLSEKDIALIEDAINKSGVCEVVVKVEGGKIAVFLSQKRKLN